MVHASRCSRCGLGNVLCNDGLRAWLCSKLAVPFKRLLTCFVVPPPVVCCSAVPFKRFHTCAPCTPSCGCCRYAHEAGGRYCLFLADVILGRVKDFGTEKAEELSRPPELKDPTRPHQLYDSVQVCPLCDFFTCSAGAGWCRVRARRCGTHPTLESTGCNYSALQCLGTVLC